jgi:hypothetical protein
MKRALRSISLLAVVALVTLASSLAAGVPATVTPPFLATAGAPSSLPTSPGEEVASFPLPGEAAALTSLTPAWMPAANLPTCYQTVCVNVCFKKGRGCTIAGQTCSCN